MAAVFQEPYGFLRALPKYTHEIVSEVLAASDIVDVISTHVELKSSGGGRFVGLCPFHHEKTPSFSVNRDRQFFHCFGCQKSGDAIGFLREYEGLEFPEALRKLADRGGIALPAVSAREANEGTQRSDLLKLNAFAATWFREMLEHPLKGGIGRRYLQGRALRPETMKRFGIGYAPDGWQNFVDAARKAGYPDTSLEASGLVRRGDRGNGYDFFRNRLIFPIRNTGGDVVAFGGRDLTGSEPAKYINTPENAVYRKGRILYGLSEGREALRHEKRAILVEGYFDLLRCVDSGIENVVASCGTALTAEQASLLHRYVPEVVVVFDGDLAGIKAALRGIALLTAAGLSVRALALPGGKDPDDFVTEFGPDALREKVDEALDFVTFYVRMNGDRLSTIEGRTDIAKEIFVLLASVDDELRRSEYIKRMANELRLNDWNVRTQFLRYLDDKDRKTAQQSAQVKVAATDKISQDDLDFVSALMSDESLLELARKKTAGLTMAMGPMSEVLTGLFEAPRAASARQWESESARVLYAAAANAPAPGPERAREIVEKRLTRIHKDVLASRQESLMEDIRRAESEKNMPLVIELLALKDGLRKQMEQMSTL